MRRNLDNEISESKRANEAYVSDTVKRFGESYNYYLHQIKLLSEGQLKPVRILYTMEKSKFFHAFIMK